MPVSNTPEFTVGELAVALKRTIEDGFGAVRLRGEVSNYRGPHSSGHAYFCLKDQTARIDAVIWKSTLTRLKVKPEEGLEVVATGKVTTFPGKSTYQIVIDTLEAAGLGALMALLEERRRKLAAEGLFDAARKQLIPFLPVTIGVVTSPTGAVIRDILHRIADRFPRNVLIWPVRVQGDTCAAEVAAAIGGFNAPDFGLPRPDVLIVARGGGSLEDLWGFNDEIVIRAAAESLIPLISAIGHETDWTLLDHVADLRAPTPTGAAEKTVPVYNELAAAVADLGRRHASAALRYLAQHQAHLRAHARALPRGDGLLALPRQRFDQAGGRLAGALTSATDRRHIALARLAHRLAGQSPQARMGREAQRLDALAYRLHRAPGIAVERRRQTYIYMRGRLANIAPGIFDRKQIALSRLAHRFESQSPGERIARAEQLLEAVKHRLLRVRANATERPQQQLSNLWARLSTALAGRARLEAQKTGAAHRHLQGLDIRLQRALTSGLERRHRQLAAQGQLLNSLGYRQVLARGFALVRGEHGQPLHRAAEIVEGARLDIEFADGHWAAMAGEREKPAAKSSRTSKKTTQGSLF